MSMNYIVCITIENGNMLIKYPYIDWYNPYQNGIRAVKHDQPLNLMDIFKVRYLFMFSDYGRNIICLISIRVFPLQSVISASFSSDH